MKRRFIAINRNNKRLSVIIIAILLCALLFILSMKWILGFLINTISNENKQIELLGFGTSNVKVIDLDLLNPDDILTVSLNLKKNEMTKLEIKSRDIEDGPLVYIYNTYDGVNYANEYLSNVLAKYGIPSLIEKRTVSEYLSENNLKSSDSYSVSREFIDEAMREHETLKYFIDIQSSNASPEVTSAKIDNLNYAKLLFVVSMNNKFYDKQLEFAETLNNILDSRLSRGITKKSDNNTYFNQDIDANCLLIEIGGKDSSKEEIENTMITFGQILHEFMSEGYYGN